MTLVLIDGQAHCWRRFDPEAWLRAAQHNLEAARARLTQSEPGHGVLVCAAAPGAFGLSELAAAWQRGAASLQAATRSIESTTDAGGTIQATWIRDSGRIPLLCIAAQQLVTAERIEVLALTAAADDARDTELAGLLDELERSGIGAILPWGLGKWLGNRGRRIHSVLTQRNRCNSVMIADTGTRPWLWPRPALLASLQEFGYRRLDGSDPLPVHSDRGRVGSYGSWHRAVAPDASPSLFWQRLFAPDLTLRAFGASAGLLRCVTTQVALRMQKRAAAHA